MIIVLSTGIESTIGLISLHTSVIIALMDPFTITYLLIKSKIVATNERRRDLTNQDKIVSDAVGASGIRTIIRGIKRNS